MIRILKFRNYLETFAFYTLFFFSGMYENFHFRTSNSFRIQLFRPCRKSMSNWCHMALDTARLFKINENFYIFPGMKEIYGKKEEDKFIPKCRYTTITNTELPVSLSTRISYTSKCYLKIDIDLEVPNTYIPHRIHNVSTNVRKVRTIHRYSVRFIFNLIHPFQAFGIQYFNNSTFSYIRILFTTPHT